MISAEANALLGLREYSGVSIQDPEGGNGPKYQRKMWSFGVNYPIFSILVRVFSL